MRKSTTGQLVVSLIFLSGERVEVIQCNMLTKSSLALIGAYQRYLSPRKGYCCAYRAHTGGRSCSSYAQQAIARAGFRCGMQIFWRRLQRCAAASHWLANAPAEPDGEKDTEAAIFGQCAPAVRESRKLCCGNLTQGLFHMFD